MTRRPVIGLAVLALLGIVIMAARHPSRTASATAGTTPASTVPGSQPSRAEGGPINLTPGATQTPAVAGGPTLSLSCPGMAATMKLGSTFTMAYDLVSSAPQSVAVGAALYDASGADQADGTGDRNSVPLTAGHTSFTRPVLIPSSLTPGTLFVYGEIWPPSQIGTGEPLVSATCGQIKVTA